MGLSRLLPAPLRVLVRLPAIVLFTIACYLLLLPIWPLEKVAPALRLRLRNGVMRLWGRGFARIVGMRMRQRGAPPAGGFFLVANHVGYMDILLLAAHAPATFVAKAELRRWPVAGAIFAAADTLFVDRTNKRDLLRVGRGVETALERGLAVTLFAEGTAGRGDTLLPFRPSLLEVAAQRDLPVHWATLSYRVPGGRSAQDLVAWWRDEGLFPHLPRLLALPGFEATITFGDVPVHDTDRKRLAERLRTAMLERFEPLD